MSARLLQRRHTRLVASDAGGRRRRVEEYPPLVYKLELIVTLCARHVFVGSIERELRLTMIEQGWPPLHRRVALRAAGDLVGSGKLRCMYVAMAVLALFRRAPEVDILHRQFKVRRTVA